MVDIATIGLAVDTRGLKRAGSELGGLSQKGQDAERKLNRSTRAMGDDFKSLNTAIKATTGALAALGVVRMTRSITDAVQSMQSMQRTFTAATGSFQKGAAELEFVRMEADRLGLNLEKTATSYGQLAAAARGTALEGRGVREVFTAVSEASTALGLSSEQSEGALRALQQMMSKGTVQAEELRGQLGERIPGAFNLMAKGLGVTTKELNKMLERGEVLADEALPALARQLRDTFGEQAIEGADQLTAQLNRLDTALYNITSGANAESLSDSIGDLADTLSDPATVDGLQTFVSAFIGGFAAITETVATTVNVVKYMAESLAAYNHGPAIGDMVRINDAIEQQNTALEGQLQLRERLKEGSGKYRANEKIIASIEKELDRLNGLREATLSLDKASAELGKTSTDVVVSINHQSGAVGKLNGATDKVSTATEKATESLNDQIKVLSIQKSHLLGGVKAQEAMTRAQLEAKGISSAVIDQYIKMQREVKALADEQEAFAETATEKARMVEDAWDAAGNIIYQTMYDVFDRSIDSFEDFADAMLDGFKQMLARMAAEALSTEILVSIGAPESVTGGKLRVGDMVSMGKAGYSLATGGWMGTQAAATGASMLGMGSQFSAMAGASQAGYTGNAYAGWVASQNAAAGGTAAGSSAASGFVSGLTTAGFYAAIAAAGFEFGKSVTSAIEGEADRYDWTNIIFPGLGSIVEDVSSRFSSGWETRSFGLRVGEGGISDDADMFTYQKRKKNFKTRRRTLIDDVDAQLQAELDFMLDSSLGSITGSIEKLGLDVSTGLDAAFEAVARDISFKGGGEKIQERLGLYFSDLNDALVNELSGGAVETADQLRVMVTSLDAVNDAFGAVDMSLMSMSISGAEAAQSLVDMAGGLQQFNQLAMSWAQFSGGDQAVNALLGNQLGTLFETLGYTLPETRDGVIALVNGLDKTTEAGQAAYVAITSATGSLEQFYSFNEAAAAEAAKAIAQSDNHVQLMLNAAQGRIDAMRKEAEAAVITFDSVILGLKELGDEAYRTNINPADAFQNVVLTFNDALEEAATGSQDALKILQSSTKDYAQALIDSASNELDAKRKLAGLRSQLYGASDQAEAAKQADQERRERARQSAIASARSAAARSSFFGEGANAYGMSLNTPVSIAATIQSIGGTVPEHIQESVNQAIGQYEYFQKANLGGASSGAVEQLFDQLKAGDFSGVPAFASGTDYFSGGMALVGEQGPELVTLPPSRIYNNTETNGLLKGMGNTAALEKEVRELRQMLYQFMFQDTKNIKRTKDILNRWDKEGRPPERAA